MRNKCELLLISLLSVVFVGATVSKLCERKKEEFQNPPDGVCGSVRIKNDLEEFRKLENCTVVEGSVYISLMEHAVAENFAKLSFPELREITAYLMLYRVYGLTTLKHLFPNLAVIGGRQLFSNYAFVVHDMLDLEELGLVNLTTISRGGVRITESKKLCYLDTVDWGRLGVDPGAQDFKDNMNQCADVCPANCPTTVIGNVAAKRCWTLKDCQKGLSCQCKPDQACMDNGTCCHEYCLGGCSGPGPENCYSCKGVTYQGRCRPECPNNTYKYADRRCLTAKECLALVNNTGDRERNTKIMQSDKAEFRLCVTQCPQNYTIQEEGELKDLECVRCKGFCPKVCNGTEVNSIEDAQELRDCSKIEGPLTIQVMSGSNVAYEMEKNLGSIREITGYLNIRLSHTLVTLYFLKSLEIIGEKNMLLDGWGIAVMDNDNLQDLFPEEQMKRMQLKNGGVTFHSNHKLCLHKIKRFVKYLNLTQPPSEKDIGENGSLMPCNEQELSLNVTVVYHDAVLLKWAKDMTDTENLLAYIINYRELKNKDEMINIYQGRDTCSADLWKTVEVSPSLDNETYHQSYALKDLKAYTTYALYVQSYSRSSSTHAAVTNITRFTTNPYYPSEPLDVQVSSDDPHELYVKWKPPKFPNGIVTHYKVLYQKLDLDTKAFELRDYCFDPLVTPRETTRSKEEKPEDVHNITAGCCPCPNTKEEEDAEAQEREIEAYFESYLHNQVYCKRYDNLSPDIGLADLDLEEVSDMLNFGRAVDSENATNSIGDEVPELYATNTSTLAYISTQHGAVRNNNLTLLIQEVIVNDTEIYLPNLEHFQEYSIEVQACHDTNPNKPVGTKLCSNRAMSAGHTKASWIMDKINESTISVDIIPNITNDVKITWEPPPKPNGLILTYVIFYKRATQENVVPEQICISIKEFQKLNGYRLTGLDPGNWTYQINAVSLAGNSSFTAEKYFIVPHSPDETGTDYAVIIIAVIGVLIFFVAVILALLFARYRYRKEEPTVISVNENYTPSGPVYTMDEWEVDRDKIKLLKELGKGSFGMVYEGVVKGLHDDPDEELRVAVKTVNDRASFNDKREFLMEATTMKAFDCFHIVKLLGVVSTSQPALVIMELMALGDLKNYLREHRPDEQERPGVSPPKLLDILQMAGEIADGMAYLADKKFVHRDLAARNCMVAEDKTVKIGDFGMTRDIYETDYYRKGGKGMLPVRWMAPESLKDGVYTSMSDVWSYGIVMWEMVTLAAQPYQGLSNEEVVQYISEDNTMDIPDRCPEEMAYLMQHCWAKKPKNRLTFKEIVQYLLPHLSPRFEKVSYFFNEGGGPQSMHGSEEGDYPAEEDDFGSINSLGSEAAAASRPSLTKASGSYRFRGSPHPSGGSLSLYDDGLGPEFTDDVEKASPFFPHNREFFRNENMDDISGYSFHNEFGLDEDETSQHFMLDDFQATPLVKTWHPTLLSHDQSGNDSSLRNSGLVELQPLISKHLGPSSQSSKLTSAQSSSPYSPEYIGHSPSPASYNPGAPGGPQTLQQRHKTVDSTAADSFRSGPASGSSHSGKPSWPAPTQVPSSLVTQPTLRLPTLNQPPSGGFQRVPPYRQGDKSSYSNRYSQPSSHDKDNPQPTSSTTANLRVASSEEESSPTQSAQHNSSPSGAIISSSDDSKESSKSSSSYSHLNGLTNGHIPMIRHRTAPC